MHLYSEGDNVTSQKNFQIFKELYDRTYDNLIKFVVCKCSNIEDVNDIIQEIYIDVYKAISCDKEINDVNKYIFGIAKNKIKKHYSIVNKIKTISLFKNFDKDMLVEDRISNNIDIEKIILDKNNIDVIWDYLRKKKINIQRIFYLYYNLDFTIKEISKKLNVSESYVKNSLYRTLKELQDVLRKD